MSRLLVACSLLAALSSTALAERAAPSFAQPPAGWSARRAPDLDRTDRMGIVAPVLDRDAVRAKLLENRAANLARFRAYRTAGVYPSNVYTRGLANVWRDQDGHYCAAATIIRASGQEALVQRVAEQNNSIKLADVTSGPLMDWILTSGLTQAEIALIQRPFSPVTVRPQPRPERPLPVDPGLRAAETRRLAALYAEIEAKLAAGERDSIALATDRLMKRPQLAAQLLAR
jgi:hypothetical protein